MLPSEVRVSLPPMVTPHRPRFTEYAAPKGGIGQPVFLEVLELLGPLEGAVAYRRDDLEFRRQRAQRDFEPHLIVACGRAAVRDHLGAERQGHLRDRLRLQHALARRRTADKHCRGGHCP